MLGNGGFIVETADDIEVLRASDLTVLPSLPKQRKAGKQGAGTAAPKPPRRTRGDRDHLQHPSKNPRTRLPQSYGRWDGPEGASNWHSDIPEVNAITGGKPVRFVNGRPVFKPWVVDTITFKPMELDGSKADFTKIYEELARRWNLSGPTAAQEELTRRRLTPHHEDSITIQLVPFDLHNHTEHIGSASDMRNGYRHP